MTYDTKVFKNAGSLRTTIPSAITNLLNIENGEKVTWTVEILGKDEVNVCIKPKKDS